MLRSRNATGFVLTLCFAFIGLLSEVSFGAPPKGKKTPINELFQLKCAANERATGCTQPFQQCALGTPPKSVVQTCLKSARAPACPNFSWEKCCATNCFLRKGGIDPDGTIRLTGMDKCMEQCGSAPASRVFWAKAVTIKKRR